MARFLFYDDKIINILLQDEKPSGGAAVQALGWIRGLAEEGQDIQVITNLKKNGPLKDDCKDIKLIQMYDSDKGVRWLRWIYYRIPYIYHSIKKTKADYLYQGVPGWQSFFISVICRMLSVKYILRISNDYLLDERFYRKSSRLHKYFLRLAIHLSYCVLCQNEYQYEIIKRGFPQKRALKLPNPIFLKNSTTLIDADNRTYIAWIGIFQYQKNLKLLFEIASKLTGEEFWVAGKELLTCDDETLYYLEKIKNLTNVRMVGFLQRHEVLPFLSKAKFLLNTSHYEGFSNTFLEAMMVKTPILTSSKVNPDSIISKYNLGIIYNDCAHLEELYHQLTPDSYRIMTNNTFDYVLLNHDYKNLAKRFISYLNNN